jgi:hypothetical protein
VEGRVSIYGKYMRFSLFHCVQTGSGTRAVSYPIGTRGYYPPGVKQLGHEADHSPPSSVEVKNSGVIPSLPHMSSWRGA